MTGRLAWLASYPRSGNTWVRAFLSAWRSGADHVDLEALEGLGTAGSRPLLDPFLGLPTSQLPGPEVHALRPALYRELSRRSGPALVKVHDAFERLPSGEALFPREVTRTAVYLVRNPLDVAPSLRRLLELPGLREAVDVLGSPGSALFGDGSRAGVQLRQRLGTWSEHVRSWTGQEEFPVCVVRYEDMLERPEESFGRILEALGEEPEPARLRRALQACRLEALAASERERGFRESPGSEPFFGPGRAGLGRDLLGPDLVEEVVEAHGEVMERFGYLEPAEGLVLEARRLHARGASGLAFLRAAEALRVDPGNRAARGLFVHHARHHRLAGRSDLRPALQAALGDPDLAVEALAGACSEALLRRSGDSLEDLAGDPLFRVFLGRTVNRDARMELFLRDLRGRLLDRHPLLRPLWPLAAGLALQGLRSGYVSSAPPGELERLPEEVDEASVLAWCLYRPLAEHPASEVLESRPEEAWSEELRPLVREGLHHPRREAELGRSTPSLGEAANPVSLAVRRQYEESPYPRWIELPRVRSRVSLGEALEEAFPGFSFPDRLRGPVRVLVPGCGTGRHPLSVALRYRTSALVALDLSRASLGMARRRAEEAGIEGVRFVHGDLLEVGRLEGGPFDLIACVGVLHHMEDPARGLAALLGVLAPGGILELGLYSERGRRLVARAREEIAHRGLGADAAAIRAFRDEALDPTSPWHPLTGTADFYTVATCRDLLFHVQEHRFTPLGLAALLEEAGLEFLGFRHRRPEVARVYRSWNPGDSAGTDLGGWERFEIERGSSTGLYQFLCRRRGESEGRVGFRLRPSGNAPSRGLKGGEGRVIVAQGKRPLNIRQLPISEADRKAGARQSLLAGAAGGVAATLLVLWMAWLATRPAPLPEPPTPLPGLPAETLSGPASPSPAPGPPSPAPLPSATPTGSPLAPAPAAPSPAAPAPAASSPAPAAPAPGRVAPPPTPRRLPLPNSYPHATATPHASAPAPQASPKPEPRAGAPRPAERQGRSDLVDVAVSRGRASNPAGPTGAVESNFSYRLSRVVNRSDETLHLSSRNLFLEDAAGRSYPVSRYYSLDLLRGQGLTEGEDPVVDEQKLTIHFDYLPKDFVPDRLVLDLDSGRVQVRVAGMMLERQSVPSIPTW